MAKNETKGAVDLGKPQFEVASSFPAGKPTATAAQGSRGDTVTKRGSGPTELPTQFGRYRIINKLGGGGMGTVYLVENTELEREEALKVPHFADGDDPQVRERFLREAKSAAKLDHANLCPIYDAGVLDGIYYLTMRFLKGKPLADYTGKPQPARKAVDIVAKLALALEAAHAKGVIHRDLKPGNVMMVSGSGPVVMDFGLAKQVRQQDEKLTQEGWALGTPAYMPPEQLKGELDQIGPAADVYSLGVILYELLTGRVPFEGTTAMICGQILYTEPPLPSALVPRLSPALDGICRKAMAKAPADRYPSMKAFAAAMVDYLRSTPATAGAGNLLPTTADKAAVSQPASVAPGRQPAEVSGLFPVAPQATRSIPPASRIAQAPLATRPKTRTAVDEGSGKRRSGGLVVGVAFGLLAIIIGFWAVVVFRVSTAEGTLVVQVNEPDTELLVDGERITVVWQNGGLKAEVGVKPGTRKVELKKDGFRAFGEEVALEDRGRTVLVARLEPIPSTPPPQAAPAVALSQQQDPQAMEMRPAVVPADAQLFGGHWYKFYQEPLSWKAACDRCQSYGGRLVSVDSLAENSFVGGLVEKTAWQDAWIGATDEAEEGKWRNVDGELLQFANWFAGQPNNKGAEEHYVLISNRSVDNNSIGWRWCDQPNEPKEHQPGFVCEWESKTSPGNGASPAVVAGGSAPPGNPMLTPPGDRARPMRNPFVEAASNPQTATAAAPKENPGIPGGLPPALRGVAGAGPQPLGCTGPNGVSADVVRGAQEAWAKYLGRNVETNVEIANGVTITFVLVPPGKFHMGSPPNEMGKNGRYHNESLHEVTLTEPFDLGKYELTQAQYEALTGKKPSFFKGDDRPVEQVTWNEADAFGSFLTKKLSDRHVYRLPTEAEWEYSCRGGRPSSEPFGVGDGRTLTTRDANFDNVFRETCKVGSYAGNALGLCDMHGNVWEWCADWNEPYPNGAVTNPLRTDGGPFRVARGGCHNEPAPECRSALRQGSPEARRDCWMGFRLARSIPPPGESPTAAANDLPPNKTAPPADAVPQSPTVTAVEGKAPGDVRDDNDLKMKFCWCPNGKMRGLWMGKYEVTQSEWVALMGSMPSQAMNKGKGDRFPIYNISLDEAIEFCHRMTSQERKAGRLPSGWAYRVPTEEQWEYACRAGTTTASAFGNSLSSTQANFNGDWPHGGGQKGPNLQTAAEVGSYQPNAWGICDMHGNVKEFTTTPGHVRGGSWFDSGRNCCSEIFIPDPPNPLESLGFRVARVPSLELKRMGRP